MITSTNLKEYFEDLTSQQIIKAMESDCDELVMQLRVCNAGYSSSLLPFNEVEESRNEIEFLGCIILDKDDLLRLFTESEALNRELSNYL